MVTIPKKLTFCFFLISAILFTNRALAAESIITLTIGKTGYKINGATKTSDAAPYIAPDGRTMVPLRLISEALGAEVSWNATKREVTISAPSVLLKLTVGQPLSNNLGVPVINNDRVFVPVRYIAEQLNAAVDWDGANKSITITQGAARSSNVSKTGDEASLRKLLSEKTNEPLIEFYYHDFDMDGSYEAFAVTSDSKDDYGSDIFSVWFITPSNISELIDSDGYYVASRIADMGSQKIFIAESTGGGSDSHSLAWAVESNKARRLTHTGQGLHYVDGEFITLHGTFDSNKTDGDDFLTGHTWKRYYLYWDKTGFKEYGGIKISLNQLLTLKGAQESLIKLIGDDEEIEGIYIRGNGIININVFTKHEGYTLYANRTTRLINGSVTIPAYSSDDGWYEGAMFPEIATYMGFNEIINLYS